MERLIQMGKELGFEGKALQDFVKAERFAEMELERDKLAQQSRDREIEREAELARIEIDKEKIRVESAAQKARIAAENGKEIELAKFALQEKERELELAKFAAEEARIVSEKEIELSRLRSKERQANKDREIRIALEAEIEKLKSETHAYARNPKLPFFEESKDNMDSYISRFEKYAVVNKWDESLWAVYLSALLTGRALEVYDRLSVEDAASFVKMKEALLKNFGMTERGYRTKFRVDMPEKSETFIQYGSRLRSYLNKWLSMAKVEKSYEALCDFMARDQFLESCSRELYVHLKPKSFKNLDDMAREADLFAEVRGGALTCINKEKRDRDAAQSQQNVIDCNKPSERPAIKCSICGKGHMTIRCYKNPNRTQVDSAEVGGNENGSRGSDSENEGYMRETQIKSEVKRKGRGYKRGRGAGLNESSRDWNNSPRGEVRQMSFCKLGLNKKSENDIESVNQSKVESPLNSECIDKEGVCYLLRSKLPTAVGTVNGSKVDILRDTGCTTVTVRKNLISDDCLTGREAYVTLIDETRQTYPLAMIDIDCPFFTGKTEAVCMKDTLHDLVIGNIDGSKLPDMSHFSAAAVTRSQTRQSEMAFRKIPRMIINENKEALKHAQANDPKLDIIRRRVESGDVTVSRGLHRGETKFIRKKDLMYRQFTLGNKVTQQLVIPKDFS